MVLVDRLVIGRTVNPQLQLVLGGLHRGQINRRLDPDRGEPGDFQLATVGIDFIVVLVAQLRAAGGTRDRSAGPKAFRGVDAARKPRQEALGTLVPRV
jgi:hypothetical protein